MTTTHLSQTDLANRWRMSPRTLERWRFTGEGPQFIKLGGRVVYRLEDIEAFENRQIRQLTPGISRGFRTADPGMNICTALVAGSASEILHVRPFRRCAALRRELVSCAEEVMNDVDLCVWVADAQPGDSIVYYTGHLSRDRLPHREGYSDAIAARSASSAMLPGCWARRTGCISCSAASPSAAGTISPSARPKRRS